jgi:guanylate kinase
VSPTPATSAPARGILVIISSPSGAGKTTLARRLLGEFDNVDFSVSYTTRPPRPGEIDGRDYTFVDDAEFDAMIARGELAEWAVVHGNRYGTSKLAVDQALDHGRDVVFDVDGQGGRELFRQFPDDALMVFILPPDLATLATRLRRRATDEPEVIDRRLRKAIEELSYHREYQYRIVNDDLDRAYQLLRAIYLARTPRPPAGADLDACRLRVAANDERVNAQHAEALIEFGSDHSRG